MTDANLNERISGGAALSRSLPAWRAAADDTNAVEEIDADTLLIRLAAWKTFAVDVRDTNGSSGPRIPEALSISLSELPTSLRGLPLQTSLSLVGETDAQSSRAASILLELGYRNLAILKGGFTNYMERGLPIVPYSSCKG